MLIRGYNMDNRLTPNDLVLHCFYLVDDEHEDGFETEIENQLMERFQRTFGPVECAEYYGG